MRQFILGILLPLTVMGCTTVSTDQTESDNSAGNLDAADDGKSMPRTMQGLAFVQAHCAACHDVTDGQKSPNPQAPPFNVIANTQGLTDKTLTSWLNDSHNYPELMDFDINSRDIDDLAAYILTLQSADYKPPIQ